MSTSPIKAASPLDVPLFLLLLLLIALNPLQSALPHSSCSPALLVLLSTQTSLKQASSCLAQEYLSSPLDRSAFQAVRSPHRLTAVLREGRFDTSRTTNRILTNPGTISLSLLELLRFIEKALSLFHLPRKHSIVLRRRPPFDTRQSQSHSHNGNRCDSIYPPQVPRWTLLLPHRWRSHAPHTFTPSTVINDDRCCEPELLSLHSGAQVRQ